MQEFQVPTCFIDRAIIKDGLLDGILTFSNKMQTGNGVQAHESNKLRQHFKKQICVVA